MGLVCESEWERNGFWLACFALLFFFLFKFCVLSVFSSFCDLRGFSLLGLFWSFG